MGNDGRSGVKCAGNVSFLWAHTDTISANAEQPSASIATATYGTHGKQKRHAPDAGHSMWPNAGADSHRPSQALRRVVFLMPEGEKANRAEWMCIKARYEELRRRAQLSDSVLNCAGVPALTQCQCRAPTAEAGEGRTSTTCSDCGHRTREAEQMEHRLQLEQLWPTTEKDGTAKENRTHGENQRGSCKASPRSKGQQGGSGQARLRAFCGARQWKSQEQQRCGARDHAQRQRKRSTEQHN